MSKRPLEEFEDRIGYKFADRSLLQQALTHSSQESNALQGALAKIHGLGF